MAIKLRGDGGERVTVLFKGQPVEVFVPSLEYNKAKYGIGGWKLVAKPPRMPLATTPAVPAEKAEPAKPIASKQSPKG